MRQFPFGIGLLRMSLPGLNLDEFNLRSRQRLSMVVKDGECKGQRSLQGLCIQGCTDQKQESHDPVESEGRSSFHI